jgi:hypothetical protein
MKTVRAVKDTDTELTDGLNRHNEKGPDHEKYTDAEMTAVLRSGLYPER